MGLAAQLIGYTGTRLLCPRRTLTSLPLLACVTQKGETVVSRHCSNISTTVQPVPRPRSSSSSWIPTYQPSSLCGWQCDHSINCHQLPCLPRRLRKRRSPVTTNQQVWIELFPILFTFLSILLPTPIARHERTSYSVSCYSVTPSLSAPCLR